MVLTRQAGLLVLSQLLVCGATFLASCCYTEERLHRPRHWRHGRRGRPACYQRACWKVNTKSLTCDLLVGRPGRVWGGGAGGLFGEEIPLSPCEVSGKDELIKLALPSERYQSWVTCMPSCHKSPQEASRQRMKTYRKFKK